MTVRDDAWVNGLHHIHCREDRCFGGDRCDCPCHRGVTIPDLPGVHPGKLLVESLGGTLQAPPYPTDCGLDLVTAAPTVLHEGETVNVPCGIRIALPPSTFGWITARSSTWSKWHLLVIPGIIDEGWRGELFTLLYRPPVPRKGDWTIAVPKGTRLAQLIVLPNLLAQTTIEQVEALPPAERGLHGFGSSGT